MEFEVDVETEKIVKTLNEEIANTIMPLNEEHRKIFAEIEKANNCINNDLPKTDAISDLEADIKKYVKQSEDRLSESELINLQVLKERFNDLEKLIIKYNVTINEMKSEIKSTKKSVEINNRYLESIVKYYSLPWIVRVFKKMEVEVQNENEE